MRVRYDMVAVHVVRPDASGRSHEFLQLHRTPTDYMGATWQIVRGTCESDEPAWRAALRELREETGLTPSEFYKLSLMETFYLQPSETVWHVPSFVAVVSRSADIQLNEEHDAHRWMSRVEIDANTMWPAERMALAEIMREVLDDGLSKPFIRLPLT